MADARLAMANRPSHPPCLSRAPVYLATKRKLEDLSDSDSDQRATPPNFTHQARYQHFSAVRTTGDSGALGDDTSPRKRRIFEETPAGRTMNIAVSSSCEECVQDCEDGTCELELTLPLLPCLARSRLRSLLSSIRRSIASSARSTSFTIAFRRPRTSTSPLLSTASSFASSAFSACSYARTGVLFAVYASEPPSVSVSASERGCAGDGDGDGAG